MAETPTPKLEEVVLAALFHDLGKFGQRAGAERSENLKETFEEQDPPWPEGSAFPPSGVFRIQEQGHYSTRQRSEMQLGGLLGQVQLEGGLQGILTLLRAAEVTHLGKEASFGLGQREVTS